jgi:hypothetical protein
MFCSPHLESISVTVSNFLNGSDDQTTIKANRFVKRFKSTSAAELVNELGELHQQVLHLSRKRPSEDELKLGLQKALKLYSWLEPNLNKFISELEVNETYKTLWKSEEVAPPTNVTGPTLPLQGQPVATNHILAPKVMNTSEIG